MKPRPTMVKTIKKIDVYKRQYGERCGNVNLCSVIANLAFKYKIPTLPQEQLSNLTALSRFVSEVANLHPISSQPFVGSSAFAHKGGIHVSAIMKNPGTYEHIQPELVGNSRRVLVSELSGLSNMLYKYNEMNLDLSLQKEDSRQVLEQIKELENQGYQFEGAEGSFELLLRKLKQNYQEPFTLESLRIIVEFHENSRVRTEAVIKMSVGERVCLLYTSRESQ